MRARNSAPVQTGPEAHPASCTTGTGPFLGVKSGRGVTMKPHPLLVPSSRKSRNIPQLPLWAVRFVQSLCACTVELYLYSSPWAVRTVKSLSACTVQLYIYSPYVQYRLYRASVPVQYSYNSTPPRTVRPLQSLSACTVEL